MISPYSEDDFRKKSRSRLRIELVGLIVGLSFVFGYLSLMVIFKDSILGYIALSMGRDVSDVLRVLLPLPCLVVLVVALAITAHKSALYSVRCPHCNQSLDRRIQQTLMTRSCWKCDKRVVAEGRVYRRSVYQRYKQRANTTFLFYWLWAWPILSLTSMISIWQFPASMAHYSHLPSLCGLVGLVLAGWCFARTRKTRFLPSMAASLFFLAIAASG